MASRRDVDEWVTLRAWIDPLRTNPNGKSRAYVVRFDRLMAYRDASFENGKKLDKAWRAVCRHALDDGAQLSIFMGLPDSIEVQPLAGLSRGKRLLDPVSERERNLEMAGYADKLLKFLECTATADPLHQLLADLAVEDDWEARLPRGTDAQVMNEHAVLAMHMWQLHIGGHVKRELQWLSHALKGANPHKWYLTKQPNADDAGRQTCVALVAGLTRYLSKPQHEALVVLGNANLPDAHLTNDQIKDALRPSNKGKKRAKF